MVEIVCTPQQIISYTCPNSQLLQFEATGAMLLIASTMLIGLFYLWGVVFKDERTKAFAKIELYEVIASAVILIIISALLTALPLLKIGTFLPTPLIPQSAGTQSITSNTPLYEAAYKYYEVLEEDLKGWIGSVYTVIIAVDEIGTRTVVSEEGAAAYVTKPFAGIAVTAKQLLYNSGIALIFAYFSIVVQRVLFAFGTALFLNYYLPLGIFLRCFTPTRRIGGALIGISLAFLAILPLINIIAYGILYGQNSVLITFRDLPSLLSNSPNLETLVNSLDASKEEFKKSSNIIIGLYNGVITLFKEVIKGVFGGLTEAIIGITLPLLAMAFITAIVIPLINLLLFIQAARGISKMLGEEVDITAITRVI